ncbi:hypothetical protein RW115_12410 [Macrococcus capreoli]
MDIKIQRKVGINMSKTLFLKTKLSCYEIQGDFKKKKECCEIKVINVGEKRWK